MKRKMLLSAALAAAYAVAGRGAPIETDGLADMEYAALDGGVAPLSMAAPKRPGKAAAWFPCGDASGCFTNAAGEKISSDVYFEDRRSDARRAFETFGEKYRRCGVELALPLAERVVGQKCRYSRFSGDPSVEVRNGGDCFMVRKIGYELYLVFNTFESSYTFAFFDGIVFRRLVQFDDGPLSDEQMRNIARARTDPAALNNLAVMICKGEAHASSVEEEYVERLLKTAASGNEPAACRNLARYYRKKGKIPRSRIWSEMAETVVHRLAAGGKKNLDYRPLSEWPRMCDEWMAGDEAHSTVLAKLDALSEKWAREKDGDSDDCYEEEKLFESWLDTFRVKYTHGIMSELPVFYFGDENPDFFCGIVVTEQTIYSRCWMKSPIPRNRNAAVARFVETFTATHPIITIRSGDWHDEGPTLYFEYAAPVSVFRKDKFDPLAKECFNRMLDLTPLVAAEQIPEIMKIVAGGAWGAEDAKPPEPSR